MKYVYAFPCHLAIAKKKKRKEKKEKKPIIPIKEICYTKIGIQNISDTIYIKNIIISSLYKT